MPELPEVETLKRGLESVLPGKTIDLIEVLRPKMWQGLPHSRLIGKTIKRIDRIAKMLQISFNGDLVILIHLKMTGQLIFMDKKGRAIGGGHPDDQFVVRQPSKYTHVVFYLTDGSALFFNDMRQFGYVKLLQAENLAQHGQIATIGVDPFSVDFTAPWLYTQLQRRPRTSVKQVLMDQSVIAGLGNIYTDESLFEAHILPQRRAAEITEAETKALHRSILHILDKALSFGGTSYKDFVHHTGAKGTMQDHLQVYRRTGLKCLRCGGGTIKRTVIGGRGTHYCPNCQK